MTQDPIRILVVDDTVTYRKIVTDILKDVDDFEVIGAAANGKIALQKIQQFKPDIITLDLEMPELDGIGLLKEIKKQNIQVGTIMLSAFTTKGAESTVAALELGAFDFVVKPNDLDIEANKQSLRTHLIPKIRIYARTINIKRQASQKPAPASVSKPKKLTDEVIRRMTDVITGVKNRPEIVVLGISTGGPQSLTKMLPELPADFPLPILIVQHMPPMFTASLAQDLNKKCNLTVSEGFQGQQVLPGHIIIAPGGKQMKVQKTLAQTTIVVNDDPPENNCRPAVDYLFRSAAHSYGGNVIGVIMTGMGYDGKLGCKLLKRRGAIIVAQNEETCVVYGMPKQPIEEGIADVIAPLDKIANTINQLSRSGVALCR